MLGKLPLIGLQSFAPVQPRHCTADAGKQFEAHMSACVRERNYDKCMHMNKFFQSSKNTARARSNPVGEFSGASASAQQDGEPKSSGGVRRQ